MHQSLVSWDVDGTLYLHADVQKAVTKAFFADVRRGQWRRARRGGRVWLRHKETMQRCRQAGGRVDEAARAFWQNDDWTMFLDDYLLPALRQVGPRPGLVNALAAIAAMGVPQVAASDFPVTDKLDALGLASYFAGGFDGLSLGAFKPQPAVFQAALDAFPTPPSQVLHIGDRADTDGVGAQRMGFQVLVCPNGPLVGVVEALEAMRARQSGAAG